jgi:K+-sensing histidine kinase KdpD
LQQLTENILDVSKIESHSLQLKKESLNVNEVILNMLSDFGCNIKKVHNNVKITFSSKDDIRALKDEHM